ncbi:TatD family hydrolase [Lentibacter sp.]|uniref:TatD family hydrolase n=1 Tax=Lentibacter sp. TaxID=2024994 RepID=UPI003F6B55EA
MTSLPKITDSHCHLDFPDFDEDRASYVQGAVEAGVHRMVTICTRLKNEPSVRAIADAFAPVFYAAGTHPMSAAEEPMTSVDELCRIAEHPKMVGIGETGLDYHYSADSMEVQQQSLRIHCAAAAETGLPLIIHARAADDDMARILAEEHKNAAFGCVMHCFSSSRELADAALDLGFYLSMSGIGTFPKSQDIRDIFASAPVERILVETDAPYLAPPPFRGKRNEPSYVVHTAKVAADVFGLRYEDFALQCEANFERLFSKAVL